MGWWQRMIHPWRSMRRTQPPPPTDDARRIREEAEQKLAETTELTEEVHEVSRRIEEYRLHDPDTFAQLFDEAMRKSMRRRRPRHQ